MNTIGFLALLYVVISTFMWAAMDFYERRNGRLDPRWLRWMFVYAWWFMPVFHGYNLAMIRYYNYRSRRKLKSTIGRFFGEGKADRVMEIIDDVVRRP